MGSWWLGKFASYAHICGASVWTGLADLHLIKVKPILHTYWNIWLIERKKIYCTMNHFKLILANNISEYNYLQNILLSAPLIIEFEFCSSVFLGTKTLIKTGQLYISPLSCLFTDSKQNITAYIWDDQPIHNFKTLSLNNFMGVYTHQSKNLSYMGN